MALLAAGGFVVAGCSAPGPEEVTFFANGTTVQVAPVRTCDPEAAQLTCSEVDLGKAGKLKVRPGQPIQISVPGAVAKGLWQVTLQNIDASGQLQQPRQPQLITSGETYAYTVTPPTGGEQTVVVEVAQVAARQASDGIQLIPAASWSLQVDPA